MPVLLPSGRRPPLFLGKGGNFFMKKPPSNRKGVLYMGYVTYEALFAFGALIVAIIALIVEIMRKK